jgi:diguanylate cyclase (GGDEF)-like protein
VPIGLLTVDRRLVVRSANAQGRRLLGVRRQGVALGRRLLDGLRAEDRHRLRDTLSALPDPPVAGEQEGVSCGEVRFESGDQGERVLRVEARARPPDGHVVLAFVDVTESRAETDQALHRANHDALTGLPNRAAILAQLREAVAQARAQGHGLAVMFVDLDRFKSLNDTLGHEAGDHLLCEVAVRMRASLGPRGVAARLGGDEFLVVLPRLMTPLEASTLAREVAVALGQPIMLAGQQWRPTASIGVSLYPEHAADEKGLLRHADLALYRAKREGRNGVRLYDPTLDGSEATDVTSVAEMARALAAGEFLLYFQPQVSLADGRVSGMGALLRWQHPAHGLLRPDRFIAAAEDQGLIHPLGEWALRTAADQMVRWRDEGFTDLRVSVKVSPRQLDRPGIEVVVGDLVRTRGLAPRQLQLQVAESALVSAAAHRVEALGSLRQLGVGLALDRFGTGASSLAVLPQVMPDTVRVDRSIVARVPEADDACSLVRAIVALARPLSLKVLAEGVEQPAQREFLGAAGVDEFQGHLAGLPMPAADATAHLQSCRAMGVA